METAAAIEGFVRFRALFKSSEPAKDYSLFSVSQHPLQVQVHTPNGLYAGQNFIHAVARFIIPNARRIIVPIAPGSRIIMFTKNAIPTSTLIKLSALPIFCCIEFLRNLLIIRIVEGIQKYIH